MVAVEFERGPFEPIFESDIYRVVFGLKSCCRMAKTATKTKIRKSHDLDVAGEVHRRRRQEIGVVHVSVSEDVFP